MPVGHPLKLVLCFIFSNFRLHHIPQRTCDTYRRICTAENTHHQRKCKFPDRRHTHDEQQKYHNKGSQRSINTSGVCVMLAFTMVASSSFFFIIPLFSRIRSKITMVALMEYPTMVSIHAIKVLLIEIFAMA